MKPGRNDPCPCGSGKKYKKCCEGKSGLNSPVPVSDPTPSECSRLAGLFNAGRFAEVETQARLLIGQYPKSGFVWQMLGLSLKLQGKDGRSALQKATELLPGDAGAHYNLGIALYDFGQLEDAVASYRQALKINPGYAEAHGNLGIALKDFGQPEEAVASFRHALKINPNLADAHNNLGSVLKDLGQLEEAVSSYRRALAIQPDFFGAHSNLGNTLRDLRQLDEAVSSYRRALAIQPDDAEVQVNLGAALRRLGQLDDAVSIYRRALEIKPDFAEVHGNLGAALLDLGQLDAAVASCRRALEIKPDLAEAHSNLGLALKDLGQFDGAVASYRRALEIKPDFAVAQNNLGSALKDLGQFEGAMESFRRALEIKPDFAEARSNLLFIQNHLPDRPAAKLLAEALRFDELATQQARPHTAWGNAPEADRCLRVGLVSGDLRNHPVGFFLESVLAALVSNASGRLELIAYPSHFCNDEVTERIKACCQGWYSVAGRSDEHVARRIRDDGIDILIDLSGHTNHNRLPMFAWKPAPVQVSWLGYFATTGVAAIDYLIADPWTLPEAEEAYFTEKIWRLPETRLCFTPPDEDVDVSPLPALANGHITFGCFNNLTKMNDAVVALWARVLVSVPGSRLFLKAKQLNEVSVRQSVVGRFAAHGIGAERLILEGESPRAEYLSAYRRVDISLDPFPYTGGTTSVEGLWMGVPVVTLAGARFLSRQGVGILMNAGLPEWIAAHADDYVARAVSHAADLQRLAALRSGSRQQVLASPLFDAPRFARHFEAALRGMWAQWCNHSKGR